MRKNYIEKILLLDELKKISIQKIEKVKKNT